MIDDSAESPFGTLVAVGDMNDIEALPLSTQGLLLQHPSDELLSAIAHRLPSVRHILTDGNAQRVTDQGVAALRNMYMLESLDLEWSSVTDAALQDLANFPALRCLDLGFCAHVSPAALHLLRLRRPELEIETDEP